MSSAPSFGIDSPSGKAVIGKNVTVKGEIHSREELSIEGDVEGTIDMADHRLTVATNGKVRANVKARDIDVIGSIHGKVEAVDKIFIRKGANFVGDIHSAGIVVEDGAYIKGCVELSRQAVRKQLLNGAAPEPARPSAQAV